MWLFNTIPEKLAANKQYSRKQMLCHQFMQLIREHSTCEHQVPFYTEQALHNSSLPIRNHHSIHEWKNT